MAKVSLPLESALYSAEQLEERLRFRELKNNIVPVSILISLRLIHQSYQ